jgi:succinate dehydrogenase/fumarate reductase flavoprotein subunit
MGGVRINASAQVLAAAASAAATEGPPQAPSYPGEFFTPMLGLFGVGEVTGGLHGANRLGGTHGPALPRTV